MNIPAIETNFDGRRFRSRTEARWAAFFKALGWRYEYEKEGYDLGGRWYLPDFFLPELDLWIEVKGAEPTAEEIELCRRLSKAKNQTVLIAVGQPAADAEQFMLFLPGSVPSPDRWVLLEDRRNPGQWWIATYQGGDYIMDRRTLGPSTGPSHDREPILSSALMAAYRAALSERFA